LLYEKYGPALPHHLFHFLIGGELGCRIWKQNATPLNRSFLDDTYVETRTTRITRGHPSFSNGIRKLHVREKIAVVLLAVASRKPVWLKSALEIGSPLPRSRVLPSDNVYSRALYVYACWRGWQWAFLAYRVL